MKEPQH